MNRPALQIAFFTAQADPRTCALSRVQGAFLDPWRGRPHVAMVERNFPYDSAFAPARGRPLWRESLSVVRQYWSARHGSFAANYQTSVSAMLAQADETVLLAGSCGLELLRRLDLSAADFARLSFVGYGAVTKQRPPCPGILVLGERDWIARGRGPAPDRRVPCGHLDYLVNAEFAALCSDFLERRLSARRHLHATAL